MQKKVWVIISFIVFAVGGVLLALYKQGMINMPVWGKKDCVPYDTHMNGTTKITLSWKTKSKCPSIVKFGSSAENLQYWSNTQINDKQYQSVVDTSKYESVRYIVIISDGVSYGIDGKAIKVN